MVKKGFQEERQYFQKSVLSSCLAMKNIDMTEWLSLKKRAVIIKLPIHSCPTANHFGIEKMTEKVIHRVADTI